MYGLTIDTSEKQLALLYLATIQGLAYGTRHIIEHCNEKGHKVSKFCSNVGDSMLERDRQNLQLASSLSLYYVIQYTCEMSTDSETYAYLIANCSSFFYTILEFDNVMYKKTSPTNFK